MGDFFKRLLHVFVPFLVFAGQHLKKQAVQVVVVLDFVGVEEGMRWVAFMIGDELGFQQLQKQNAVDPGDGQFERYIEKPFCRGAAELGRLLQAAQFIQAVELDDGIFKYSSRVALAGFVALDQFFAPYFHFGQSDDVQQLAVKASVQAVAVVGERQFQEVFRRQELEQGDQGVVVCFIGIAQRFLKVLEVEVGKFKFGSDARDERLGNVFVEKIGFGICQASGFKVLELFDEGFVLCEEPVEQGGVKKEPLVEVGCD